MTLLFEMSPQIGGEMPIDLVSAGQRGVSLLEFMAVDAGSTEAERAPALVDEAAAEALAVEQRAAQTRIMIDAARHEAAAEAREVMHAEMELCLGSERQRVQAVVAAFTAERERYFVAAEGEIVRLALAVAARVLSREVAADRLALEASVRAALSRVQDGNAVMLRTSPDSLDAWRDAFAIDGESRVQVSAEVALQHGDVVLETRVGRVELGIAPQLEEIGRWFRELVDRSTGVMGSQC